MESHERFVYTDELMKRQFQLPLVEKEVHVYGSGTSYMKDMEELVTQVIGRGSPRIDEVAIRMARKIYDDHDVSYKNTSEFIMHSF